ncbi:hypothetical protein D1007_53036 [Hordeum vulgare]|nr:hypothetical protein D1007_53036 [Hordeum vulgare]
MADARRACAERRATRVAHITTVGPADARRSPSPMANAATGPDAQEQQGSSELATSSPTARHSVAPPGFRVGLARPSAVPHGRRALAMATELLRYRTAPGRHDDWPQRIDELVAATGI